MRKKKYSLKKKKCDLSQQLLIFQYFLCQEGILILLINHQFNWSKYELNAE